MKKKALSTNLIALFAITLFDILGAIVSRKMNFNYAYLGPISFMIYFATAFFIAKQAGKKTAIISVGLLGLFDATVGWKLSIIFQANTGNLNPEITPAILVTTIVFVTLYGALIGLAGWWLSTKVSREK